ncbi:MAG TPA: FkbM family methyltransferase [Thermoanaerobaculia bacterium]|nr:FkbM family methyltransferase [Thermoanaerobaculia bacterium]
MRAIHEFRASSVRDVLPPETTPYGFVFSGRGDMQNGTFEAREAAVVQAMAKGRVYVDVGAHHGYFVAIAKNAGAHVIAVEPLRDNLTVLYDNLMLNHWSEVEVFPVAAGARSGAAELYGTGTAASLVANWAGMSTVWHRRVAVATLDAIVGNRFAGQKMFIKVDTEGSELDVLAGAAAVLERAADVAWMIEICFRENQPNGVINPHFRATFETMWRAGYSATAVSEAGEEIGPADVDRWLRSGSRDVDAVNFVFTRREA